MVETIFSITHESLLLLKVDDDRAQEMQLPLFELAPRFSSPEAVKNCETQVVRQVTQVLLS